MKIDAASYIVSVFVFDGIVTAGPCLVHVIVTGSVVFILETDNLLVKLILLCSFRRTEIMICWSSHVSEIFLFLC